MTIKNILAILSPLQAEISIIGGFYLSLITNMFKKLTRKQLLLYTLLVLCFIGSLLFVYYNHSFYERPIAKVIETHLEDTTPVVDTHQNEDKIFTQHIVAILKNGNKKGEKIELTNKYSTSGAFDYKFENGNELFVWININSEDGPVLTGVIEDVKRDKYLAIAAWIFIFILLLVGKKQGFYSIISLAFIAIILSFALDIYVDHPNINLLMICGVAVILFTIITLLLVNGANEKTYAAIIATLLGTFSALLITYLVMWITSENGLRYEEMDFLTRPYQLVFMAGLFIGSLGAVMDVAISMSASVFELYEKDPRISIKILKKSGMEIGRDIMGTMTNILFFAYMSGSIPMLILFFKNHAPLGFSLSMNLSLEVARALSGGIGIVLTIPIGLYTSIYFVQRKRAKS